ncbi:EAL domain-containing protein [Marinobacterium sp. D7]|uniref:bifunctional diguanylate cyclase/phosphodiesterase n=1 Tax=Marinobacterium ramblicola TaxID=2849041 RepID=UPI001C2DB4E7|nr:LapD/MoxY N-terminal periplasmic domain-containing protein [Marinobacterium ramblicola]MBV1788499.1 EAL domain-containing protein [Marinobacterium ramblicola]
MTLSKQLMLLISAMFLAIFAINFYTSLTNIRDYLQVESEVHAQDTATSLGLSLSPYILDEDDTILATMVNTIFDRGYYLEILLENMDGKELVRRTNPKTFEEVPQWFTELLPMNTVTADSEIDGGWVVGGTVYVTIHPGLGYLKLWQQAKDSLTFAAISLVVFIALLFILIRFVLSPLGRIEKLALSIADGHFATIDKLPWTTEIRNVAHSMNLMSGKIEKVITNLNNRLEETGKRLRIDELTGLETRATFETDMKERFMARQQGYLFIIRIDELGKLAATLSSDKVDTFIRQFVHETRTALKEQGVAGDFLYRIVGSEFILIADCQNQSSAEQLCQAILKRLADLGKAYDKESVAHIGAVAFDPQGTTAELVSAATEAYEKARLIGQNSFAITQYSANTRSMDEWKRLVGEIVDHKRVEIDYGIKAYSLADGELDKLVLEEAMSRVLDEKGDALPIGTFISVAENLGRILEFDLHIVQQVIERIRREQIEHDIAVNVSFTALASNEFRSELYTLLQENKDVARHLVFSVTAYGATRDIKSFSSFIDFIHRNGARIILKRFESRFISMDDVKQFRLDYIRLARIYTENIGSDAEKRRLVEAMKELGELLNVNILAESVESEADYRAVREIGLTAASR